MMEAMTRRRNCDCSNGLGGYAGAHVDLHEQHRTGACSGAVDGLGKSLGRRSAYISLSIVDDRSLCATRKEAPKEL